MAVSAASPNVDNYSVFKGVSKFWKTGASDYRDMGNTPTVELTATVEKLDHFSSRTGVKSKDRSIVVSKSMTLRIIFDEFTPDNWGLALMGEVHNSSPEYVIDIFTLSEITGAYRLVGTNQVGAPVQMDLPSVSFTPSSAVALISEEFATAEITGEVLVGSDGSFGQMLWNVTGEVTTITV